MEEQLTKIYQAEIEALRTELHLTRNYIYRDYAAKGISTEAAQDLVDQYIKNVKQENY